MRLKKSRTASFAILLIIYILAGVIGIILYKILPFEPWLRLLLADVLATVFVFIFSIIFKNASVYDPYWSVQPPVIITAFALGKNLTGYGIMLIVAIWFWGIRLTANWAYTFKGLEYQDWRYTKYEESTGKLYPFINFTGIHLVPTLIVYFCTLPAVFAINLELRGNILSYFFCLFSIGAATMQGIADIEMHKFQKHRTSQFIRTGLWKYARHPNYLGEILMWWGIALSFLAACPERFYLIIGAILNTILFLTVSVPLAEGKQCKKEGYLQYKEETHVLFPFKKQSQKGTL